MQQKSNKNILFTKRNVFWTGLFLILAILSVISIMSFNKSFSFKELWDFMQNVSIFWLILAILSVLLFILFEGCSITCVCKAFGYKTKKSDGFFYSSADIYFSNITPSATGGQPASAYFMFKDGIPAPVITVSLLCTLMMYSVSIIIINIITFILDSSIFLNFSLLSKLFVIIGLLLQIVLIILYYCILCKENLLYKICNFILKILSKLHIVYDIDKKTEKLYDIVSKYKMSVKMLKNKKSILIKVFIFNFLQRVSQICVIAFTFLAFGGNISKVISICAIESLVIIGSYCIPIPGAMGVTDYLMLEGFKNIMPLQNAINLELISRALSFYCCIIVCGISVIIKYYLIKRSKI